MSSWNLTSMENHVKWAGLDTPITDLGYANSWFATPYLVERCNELGHEVQEEKLGECLRKVSCNLCKYKYMVDSSG